METQAGRNNALKATDSKSRAANRAARCAVFIVFVLNVQCAVSFIVWPEAYAASFELGGAGVAGKAAVAGLGVAFLMWNATYPAVIVNPRRFRTLYVVVLVQQIIGLIGESTLRLGLPAGHEMLAASIDRFVVFDALGLLIMGATFIWLILADRTTLY